MKSLLSIVLVVATAFALSACSNYSKRNYTEVPLSDGEEIVPFNEFCYFETEPQGAAFKIVKKKTVVAGNVYGSPTPCFPSLKKKSRLREETLLPTSTHPSVSVSGPGAQSGRLSAVTPSRL